MLNFCDFIQVFVFTRNHHLNTKTIVAGEGGGGGGGGGVKILWPL